jgi:rare lipoprotein A
VPVAPATPPEQVAIADPPPLPETVTVVPVVPTQIYVQAGSFASIDRAVRMKMLLDKLGPVTVTDAKVNGLVVFRVRVGPVGSVDQADALLAQVVNNSPDARIVVN